MLDRRDVVKRLVADRGDLLVVPGLGAPTYDVAAAGDHPLNFYLWGAMGGAAMIGLGLALARPDRRVAVITGDGEMLMGLGSLATIGVKQPSNLAIVVLDNLRYGETGMQASHTAAGIDLIGIAKSCRFTEARAADNCESRAWPGLFLLGMPCARNLNSAFLRGIAADARAVANRIANGHA